MARPNRTRQRVKFPSVQNVHEFDLSIASREIFLHGDVTSEEEPGVDYRMAVRLEKNLRLLNQRGKGDILIHMHTVGGEWADGMGMYDAIQASESPVIILAYAHARSMSSIILQAVTRRVLMPSTVFMIHYGDAVCTDTTRGTITFAEQLKIETERMMDIYALRCFKGAAFKKEEYSKIREFLKKQIDTHQEWFLCAHDAVYYGFADGVFGDVGFKTLAEIRK